MNNSGKTKAQLIKELEEMRQQVAESKAPYHRHSKEALIKSEDNYRKLVENLNIGIYRNTGGPHGHFVQANSALSKIFGYAPVDEFMKVSVYDLYDDPEDRKRYAEESASEEMSAQEMEIALQAA
jgi:PAS domain-containing protein